MKLGFYGGTFDPVHHGHLILAREAVERLGLERLFFVPNALSPHKAHRPPTPAALRLAMLRAAIADEPRFAVDELELTRPGVSYTVDTVLALRERHGAGAAFFFLVGGDNLAKLPTWRRFDELEREVTFVVFGRGEAAPADRVEPVDAVGPIEPVASRPTAKHYPTLHRRFDVSATEIRQRVAAGLSIRYLVPESVRELIARHGLYR